MSNRVNLNELAKLICEREVSAGREVNITEVKRVLRHVADLMAEKWYSEFDLSIAEALRRNGLGRLKKK